MVSATPVLRMRALLFNRRHIQGRQIATIRLVDAKGNFVAKVFKPLLLKIIPLVHPVV